MLNNLNNDIISKSQLHEKISQNVISDELFAKTVSYSGIQHNFHLDVPEILNYETSLQERTDDIKKFTELAMSSVADVSCEELINNIYLNDEYAESEWEQALMSELSINEKLLKNLGL